MGSATAPRSEKHAKACELDVDNGRDCSVEKWCRAGEKVFRDLRDDVTRP